MYIEKVTEEMKKVFQDVPYGIEHTLRVLENADDIMQGERIREDERELISIAAILHDIGAIEAQRKYGSMDALYQEKEGPGIARDILEKIGYDPIKIDRVCYIIGNHHTPSKIDGLDFQIQWEADLLENLAYMDVSKNNEALKKYIDHNFRTNVGRSIAYERFGIE
jgi:urease accessory protein UreE